MIAAFKDDPVIQELAAVAPTSRVTQFNGLKTNFTVADLVDDLDAIYKVDNSKKGKAEREQWRKNQLYVDTLLKQKHLK